MSDAEWDPTVHEYSSKKAYESVLSKIDHNTGGEQPAMVPKTSINQLVSHSNLSHEQARAAYKRAKERGAVFEWKGQVCLRDEPSLLAVIEDEMQSDVTQKAVIAKANAALQEVRDG